MKTLDFSELEQVTGGIGFVAAIGLIGGGIAIADAAYQFGKGVHIGYQSKKK